MTSLSDREREHADALFARTRCGRPAQEREAAAALARWAAGGAERTGYLRRLEAASLLVDAVAPALKDRYPRRDAVPRRPWAEGGSWLARAAALCGVAALLVGAAGWIDPPLSRLALETDIGERKTVALRDGSRITLNTASRIEVALRWRSRQATLAAGEALPVEVRFLPDGTARVSARKGREERRPPQPIPGLVR